MLNGTPRANRKCIENEPRALGGSDVMQILKAGVLYVALVFGAGFVLGTVRTQLECILASVLFLHHDRHRYHVDVVAG